MNRDSETCLNDANINAEYFTSGNLRIKLTNHFKKNGKTIDEIITDRIVRVMREAD